MGKMGGKRGKNLREKRGERKGMLKIEENVNLVNNHILAAEVLT